MSAICGVCNKRPSKYGCKKCGTRYCNVRCYKAHKNDCPPKAKPSPVASPIEETKESPSPVVTPAPAPAPAPAPLPTPAPAPAPTRASDDSEKILAFVSTVSETTLEPDCPESIPMIVIYATDSDGNNLALPASNRMFQKIMSTGSLYKWSYRQCELTLITEDGFTAVDNIAIPSPPEGKAKQPSTKTPTTPTPKPETKSEAKTSPTNESQPRTPAPAPAAVTPAPAPVPTSPAPTDIKSTSKPAPLPASPVTPSPAPAVEIKSGMCGVCGLRPPKYTCRKCGTKYCKVACYKKHKLVCNPTPATSPAPAPTPAPAPSTSTPTVAPISGPGGPEAESSSNAVESTLSQIAGLDIGSGSWADDGCEKWS